MRGVYWGQSGTVVISSGRVLMQRRKLQFLHPLTEPPALWLKITSSHPYTLTDSISLQQLLFVYQHAFFPINIISVCIKLARGHLCFSITCQFFLPSHCISAALNLSSLNDWSEWEVGLGIRGKRTMRALAVLELPFSPFMRWGGPFSEWDVKKVTADLFWKCFFPPSLSFLFSRSHDFVLKLLAFQ